MNQIDPLAANEFRQAAAVAEDHQRILAVGRDRHMIRPDPRQGVHPRSSRRSDEGTAAGSHDRRGDVDSPPLDASLFAESGQDLENREGHGQDRNISELGHVKVRSLRRGALGHGRRRCRRGSIALSQCQEFHC
jgi:hypothetical protein